MKKAVVRTVVIELALMLISTAGLFIMLRTYLEPTVFERPLIAILLLANVFVILFFGRYLNRIAVLLLLITVDLFLIAQTVYRRAFHTSFHLKTAISLLPDLIKSKDSAEEFLLRTDLFPLRLCVTFFFLFSILSIVYERHAIRFRHALLIKLFSLLLLLPMYGEWKTYLSLIEATKQGDETAGFLTNETDYYLYSVVPNTNQFVQKFGLLPLAVRDAERIIKNDVLSKADRREIETYLKELPEHTDNKMTGLLKGKDIIMIQAESLNHVAIIPELTPTLAAMVQNGINIHGFNTPALPGSTSDTELMANTSIMPDSDGNIFCYSYPYNTFPTTLASLFRQNGYITYAIHNNYGAYYNRSATMKTFGYDFFLDCLEMGLPDTSSDTAVADIIRWIFTDEKKPYLAYWISYSGHQPYNLSSVGVSEADTAKIRQLYPLLEDSYVSYLAKNMDFDRSLQMLVKSLRDAGKLNNTVFVIFGDHIVKSLDFGPKSSFYQATGTPYDPASTNTDLFLYCPDIEAAAYSKIATALDLLPTIANLWDIRFDEHTVLGRDIFDPAYNGFFFSEWEFWKTDDYQYDFMYDTYYNLNDYDPELAAREMADGKKKRRISSNLLRLDYFAESSTN